VKIDPLVKRYSLPAFTVWACAELYGQATDNAGMEEAGLLVGMFTHIGVCFVLLFRLWRNRRRWSP
jgi:hypothetical protein